MPYADPLVRSRSYKTWRERNKDHLSEYNRRYRNEHRDRVNRQHRVWARRRVRLLKRKVYELLGNRCRHCGNTDERVFQLHHPNHDGHEARSQAKMGGYFLKMLESVECDSESIHLLCANCHAIEHYVSDDDKETPPEAIKRLAFRYANRRRLTDDEVRQLRTLYNQGVKGKPLGTRFGIDDDTARKAAIGKTYRWVT